MSDGVNVHRLDQSHYDVHDLLVNAARSGAMGEGPDGYMSMTPEQRAAYKEARALLWGALYGRQGYGKGMQAKRKMGATTGRMSDVNPDLKAIPGHPRVFAEARAEFQETFCKFNYDWQTPKKEANDNEA